MKTNITCALRAPLVGKVGLLVIAFAITVLLGETLARFFLPQWTPRTAAITRLWQYNRTLGWSHIPNSTGSFKALGFETSISINSKGFRDKERSYERRLSNYRIVVLGDSMVWGYGVEQREVFTSLMERLRRDAEVVNLGISGYGTDQELLLFQIEGVRYQPDLVIVVVSENDFLTNVRRRVFFAYQKPMFELTSEGDLVLTNAPVPKQPLWMRTASMLVRTSYLANRCAKTYERLRSRRRGSWPPRKEDPVWKLPFPRDLEEKITVELLLEMQQKAQSVGARFLLVLADGLGVVGRDMENFFKRSDIPVLNLDPLLNEENAEILHIPDGVHWSALGHEKVAKSLLAYLENENFPDGPTPEP